MTNNQMIHFVRRLADEDEEEERSIFPPKDPLELFHGLSNWKPPRPSTPIHFSDLRMESGDEYAERVISIVIAQPHQVTVCLAKNAPIERVIEVLKRRTGLDGVWDDRIASDKVPRVVELTPRIAPSVPCGFPQELAEARVFFGTLEHKGVFNCLFSPHQVLEEARSRQKLGKDWVVDKSFAETKKSPKIIVAKWAGDKPTLQAFPDGITSFIASHMEKGIRIGTQRIKCKGGESPDQQAELVTRAFGKPVEISDWRLEADGEVHIQRARLAFTPMRFMMVGKVIDSWQQVSANNTNREKLASVLFGERVSLKRQLFDDGNVLVYETIPFAKRYVKRKDDGSKTRKMTFPGAPPPDQPIRMPVETRSRWGDNSRQTYMVESVVDGSKTTKVFDPTQRVTKVDPDVEEIVRGHNREVPGDVIERDVTWTGPAGNKVIVPKLKIPVKATPQDLVYRVCLALKKQELEASFVEIQPGDWSYARAIAISFQYERPELGSLREVNPAVFSSNFDPRFPVFVETDGSCARNQDKRSPGGWGAALVHHK
jgi:hypothetical protein